MTDRVRKIAEASLLLAVVVCAYGNSLQGSFQYDDFHSIVRNAALRDLGNLAEFFVDPTLFSGDAGKAMYRPVLLASYAFNHALHGYEVAGYHIVNVWLHLICTLFLWRLAARVTAPRAALAAALLFAAHPITTEPVNYISSRSELLLGVFFLGSMWAHARATLSSAGRRLPMLAVLLCALALLSKATAVMLAPALLVFDLVWLRWQPTAKEFVHRHGLYWAFSAAYVLTIAINGFLGGSLAAPVRGMTAQALTQIKGCLYYVRLLVMPRPLSVDHAFTESTSMEASVVLAAIFLGTLVWMAVRGWRFLSGPIAGMLIAGLILLPTSIMPLNVLINERRLYLVLAALCLSLASLVPTRLRSARASVALAVLVLVLLTGQRNEAWATQTTLWESARNSGSESYRTWVNLGKAYHEQGNVTAAWHAYETALEIDDRHGDVFNNLAVLLHQDGQPAEAIAWYAKALKRYPEMDEIYQNLADAHVELGDFAQAQAVFEAALAMDETNGAVWNNLGEVRMRRKDRVGAEHAFRRALQLLPDQHEPANNLGNALDAQGTSRYDEAVQSYRSALRLASDASARALIYANLGETVRRHGESARAAVLLDSSLAQEPTSSGYDFRGRVALELKDTLGARNYWTRSVQLDPTRGTAWTGLGELALDQGEYARAEEDLRKAVPHGGGMRARWNLGQALEGMGRQAAARREYEQLVSRGAENDPRVAAARRRLQVLDDVQ